MIGKDRDMGKAVRNAEVSSSQGGHVHYSWLMGHVLQDIFAKVLRERLLHFPGNSAMPTKNRLCHIT